MIDAPVTVERFDEAMLDRLIKLHEWRSKNDCIQRERDFSAATLTVLRDYRRLRDQPATLDGMPDEQMLEIIKSLGPVGAYAESWIRDLKHEAKFHYEQALENGIAAAMVRRVQS